MPTLEASVITRVCLFGCHLASTGVWRRAYLISETAFSQSSFHANFFLIDVSAYNGAAMEAK